MNSHVRFSILNSDLKKKKSVLKILQCILAEVKFQISKVHFFSHYFFIYSITMTTHIQLFAPAGESKPTCKMFWHLTSS